MISHLKNKPCFAAGRMDLTGGGDCTTGSGVMVGLFVE
jgi:hypothetical protein